MSKRLFLVWIIAILLSAISIGCDNGPTVGEVTTQEQRDKAAQEASLEREAAEQAARLRDDCPKLDNSDHFYDTRGLAGLREPTQQPTPNEDGIRSAMLQATNNEREYERSRYELDHAVDAKTRKAKAGTVCAECLSDAFGGFAKLALYRPAVLTDAKRTWAEIWKRGFGGTGHVDTVLSLHKAFPDDPEVKGMLVQVRDQLRRRLNEDLRKAHYDLGVRYTRSYVNTLWKSGKSTPEDCMYEAWDFQSLARLETALGNEQQAKFWTVRLADDSSYGHGCEKSGDNPWIAYDLYVRGGDEQQAKAMAEVIAAEVMQTYLQGEMSTVCSVLWREAFLPFDLTFAKEWLKKAGWEEDRIEQWVKSRALEQAKESESECQSGAVANVGLGYCTLAQRQYEFAGRPADAERMSLLAPKRAESK